MKRGKKLFSLLLVLVLVLGATYAATLWSPENQETEEEIVATTIFTLDAERVTALSWDYSESVSFEKKDDAWIYSEDEVFPLDRTYIDTILDTLTEVTSYKTIENVEDWDQYTLEAPYCEITVTIDGTTHTLKIGEETAMGGERYFSIGDGNAYLVDSAIIDPFSYGLYDLLSYEEIPDMTSLHGLELQSYAQSYEITLLENSGLAYSDEYIWFMDELPLDSELTETLLGNVAYLSWGDCVNYNAADLSIYGLDTPVVTATAYYTQTVDIATNETDEDGNIIYESQEMEESFTLEIGDETGDYRYARISDSNMVYKIDASVADTLMYTTYYELQPDEVLLMDWDDVYAMDIVLDGVTYEIVKDTKSVTDEEGNTSEETVYLLGGEEVDAESIMNTLDGMESAGYAAGLTPERSEEIRFVIHRNHETFPKVELVFYTYNSTACLTTLNGAATVFADREYVVNLIEVVNTLVLD